MSGTSPTSRSARAGSLFERSSFPGAAPPSAARPDPHPLRSYPERRNLALFFHVVRSMTRRRIIRWTLVLAPVLLAGAQLVPMSRTNPGVGLEVVAPADVQAVLKRACWNCHSNQTVWPWYAHIAPASWLVTWHVRNGRAQINFSEWPALGWDDQVNRELIWKEVEKGEMPPRSYLWLHPEARLTDDDRERLRVWSTEAPAMDFDPLFPTGMPR